MRYRFFGSAKKIKIIFLTLCYAVIILIGYLIPQNITVVQHINLMGWIGWGLLLWSIWSWSYLFDEIFCPNLIFLGVGYLFTFSQSLLLPFGIVPDEINLLYKVWQPVLLEAQFFTLICWSFYHIGCVWGGNKKIVNQPIDIRNYTAIKKVGIFVLLLSCVPYVLVTIPEVLLVSRYGYGALYTKSLVLTGTSAILLNIAEYFQPALICLLIAATFNKGIQKNIYIIFVAIILITLYMGGRSEAVILIVLLLLYHHYYVARLKGFKLLFWSLVGFILLSFLTIVADIRSEEGRTFGAYLYAFTERITTDNLAIQAICEMGGSMFPLAQTIELVPEQYPFRWGSTYLYAFTSVIPNLNFWDIHPAMQYANLGDWLQRALSLNYGPGYSLVAEAFINWGWYGFIFFVLYGWVNGRIFTLVNKENVFSRPDLFCFVLIILLLTIKTNRNSFLATVRAFFYIGVPIYLMCRYFYFQNLKAHIPFRTKIGQKDS